MTLLTSVWNKTGITALNMAITSLSVNSILIERGTIVAVINCRGN